jgi:hypothetical protein
MESSTLLVLKYAFYTILGMLLCSLICEFYFIQTKTFIGLQWFKIPVHLLVFIVFFVLYYRQLLGLKVGNWSFGSGMFFAAICAVLYSFIYKYIYSLFFSDKIIDLRAAFIKNLLSKNPSVNELKNQTSLFDFYHSNGFQFVLNLFTLLFTGFAMSILVTSFNKFKLRKL